MDVVTAIDSDPVNYAEAMIQIKTKPKPFAVTFRRAHVLDAVFQDGRLGMELVEDVKLASAKVHAVDERGQFGAEVS